MAARALSCACVVCARAFSSVLRAPGDEPFDLNMLSEDEIAQLRTVFNEVDTNASGDIDEDELYE